MFNEFFSEKGRTYFEPKYGDVYRLSYDNKEFSGVYFGITKLNQEICFELEEVSKHLFLVEKNDEVIKYLSDFYDNRKCLVMFRSDGYDEPSYPIVPVITGGFIDRIVEREFAKERIFVNINKK